MAFEEIKISNTAKPDSKQTGVSAGLAKIRGCKALLRMTLREAVLQEADWTKDTKFKVLIGNGDDWGMIRLVSADDGASLKEGKVLGGAAIYRLSLGHRPEFPDAIEASTPCQWEVVEPGTIEIVLPAWAGRKPTNQKAENQPSAMVAKIPGETEYQRQAREAAERRARMGMR
jgi:hypothetical protein